MEIAAKRDYEEKNRERKLNSSKRTGIPYDLVDSDVVRIGTLLGLIKSLDVLEGKIPKEETFSLLNLFLGGGRDNNTIDKDYSKIPSYFSLAPNRITEENRIENHRTFVNLQCAKFCSFVSDMLRQEMNDLECHLYVNLPDFTVETFIDVIKINISVVLESLETEDDEELWDQLFVLRNSLIGSMNICEYKNLVVDQISYLVKCKKSKQRILKNLSFIDANLSLYSGFQTVRGVPSEIHKIQRELIVRSHMKNPELKPFDLKIIIKECCVPSVMFVNLNEIISQGIIGPYRYNSICYTNNGYYVLKSIINDIRLWILDEDLTIFSEKLRNKMLNYTTNIFQMYWYESKRTKCKITECLINNIKLLCQPHDFRNLIKSVIKTQSLWHATELDVFDSFIGKDSSVIKLADQIDLPECLLFENE
jgi:hypothetical protein